MSYKLNKRMDYYFDEFEKGLNFCSPSGTITQLNDLTVLNVAIDTVKQFYNGTISRQTIQSLDRVTLDGSYTYEKESINTNNHLHFSEFNIPFDANVSRMGKLSGYQYKIQNNDIGIVILLKSFHKPNDEATSHCKIELSPHFIASHTPKQAQKIMDDIASMYLIDSKPCGIAPHLCVDLQGWDMPLHMEDHIKTRSKQITTYNGIDNVEFDIDMESVLVTYGRKQSIRIGAAKAIQSAIYRKDLEIIKSDKVDFFHELWTERSLGSFDKEKPVWRFEKRFHHTVIKEFERGIGEDINSYLEVSSYLNDLWIYALKTIRYQIKDTIAPIWQFLMEDISFNDNHLTENFKRKQKTKTDVLAVTRSIGHLISNFLTLKARHKTPFTQVRNELQSLSVMEDIIKYILNKKQQVGMFWSDLEQSYLMKLTATKYS